MSVIQKDRTNDTKRFERIVVFQKQRETMLQKLACLMKCAFYPVTISVKQIYVITLLYGLEPK